MSDIVVPKVIVDEGPSEASSFLVTVRRRWSTPTVIIPTEEVASTSKSVIRSADLHFAGSVSFGLSS
jgi:hypothetical protein